MSAREALIEAINQQPESVLREVQHYLDLLVEERKHQPATNGWPKDYFEKTAGALADEPLERPPQLPFERREEW